ncbi:MAG: hypothetical protein IJK24_06110 [Oscillospiraceae bacterium]|nr:hypothetical protein [Oscillospiraceae bacterium]
MERQTEQEVWRRVRGPAGPTAAEALLPERLEALILEQRSSAAALRALARRLRGRQASLLAGMAAGTDATARELTALHYLLSGRRLRLQTPPAPPPGPLPEALRAACQRMRQSERAFSALQAEFSDYAEDFAKGARQSRNNTRTLMELLQSQLDQS